MDKSRPCGCKGCRTCLICEKDFAIKPKPSDMNKENSFVYCPFCNKAWPGWYVDDYKTHPQHEGDPVEYPGIFIDMNFLSETEEKDLLENIDSMPWDLSQSGRRKQNFGPKCNFKKRKLRVGTFSGFPKFSRFVQQKFQSVVMLKDFQTIEQCSLEYDPNRGASIDPHIDDCWIWGERIVTVNLASDSVLTMTYNTKPDRYNLDCVRTYPMVVKKDNLDDYYTVKAIVPDKAYPVIRVPMPRRSLLVIYGAARYDWEHQVLREDIVKRRVCLAYREFTPPYLEDGENSKESREIFRKAKEFWDYKQ